MKLLQTNLYDPEPNYEDFIGGLDPVLDAQYLGARSDEYQRLLSEWKRRQVKPDKTLHKFTELLPKKGQEILLWANEFTPAIKSIAFYEEKIPKHHKEWMRWSKSDFLKDLQYYEQHRLKYEGFEYKKQDELIELIHPSGLVILLPEGDEWLLTTSRKKGFNLVFDEGLSQSLFTQICKENGIKLKEI
jgi:hypothetical protein